MKANFLGENVMRTLLAVLLTTVSLSSLSSLAQAAGSFRESLTFDTDDTLTQEQHNQQLDSKASAKCEAVSLQSERTTSYDVDFGHTNHYTVTVTVSADYICQ